MGEGNTPEHLVLVQDLVNSLDMGAGTDTLDAPGGLAAFAARHRLTLGPEDLPGVRELREALRAACLAHAGAELPADRAAELERWFTGAPLVVRFDGAGRAALAPAAPAPGARELAARIAASVARAEVDGSWQRLKACPAEDCQWAYYDRSPAGRRRWCSMQVCGSRAKMRAYRAKRR
ncbi:CGNR zinc finger domain-containing protein [Streptomyces sodiiphilus]|uniref:CGNR zinc finger domain-containing protein n=1 Tax=Streptomyces sodiiphilus TaxID=226217 RepID=A0ABN2PLX2_9ACTN